jgi:hypothetical protein
MASISALSVMPSCFMASSSAGRPWVSQPKRRSTRRPCSEWKDYVTRQARWVDFDNDYKTLNPDYMESVIGAFKARHAELLHGLELRGQAMGVPAEAALHATALLRLEAGHEVLDPAAPP